MPNLMILLRGSQGQTTIVRVRARTDDHLRMIVRTEAGARMIIRQKESQAQKDDPPRTDDPLIIIGQKDPRQAEDQAQNRAVKDGVVQYLYLYDPKRCKSGAVQGIETRRIRQTILFDSSLKEILRSHSATPCKTLCPHEKKTEEDPL